LEKRQASAKWDLELEKEITVWYGEEGVDNCRCEDCVFLEEEKVNLNTVDLLMKKVRKVRKVRKVNRLRNC